MAPRGVAILGSTGSIGRSTLAVLRRHPDRFRLVALTGGCNREALEAQAAEWRPALVGLAEPQRDANLPSGPGVLVDAALHPDVDIVVNAVVGAAGLDATIAALRAGKRVALANKETLVMGGELVLAAARAGRGEIVPIDSEHSAVLQCVTGAHQRAATPAPVPGSSAAPGTPGAPGEPEAKGWQADVARIILTGSGGPFRDWDAARLWDATVGEALRHPTWQMGRKISVDSATLANKALEVIEAHYLFGLPYDALDVVIHPQSIVHALVEFRDGGVVAQLGFPSMELPILYALTYPERLPDTGIRRFDPLAAGPLTFEPVRQEVFGAFRSGIAAGRAGGTAPAVFNAANETAVAAFLEGCIPFGRISEVIERVLDAHRPEPVDDLETVRAADRWARVQARALVR